MSIEPGLLELIEGFRVYPNPTSDAYGNWVFIEHHNDYEKTKVQAVVYNMFGQQVMIWEDQIEEKGFQFQGFQLNGLPEGTYLVKLVAHDREKVYRIIKY